MEKLVLVTRPIEQARQFAAEITAPGVRPVMAALLDIVFHPIDWSLLNKPQAILVTSPQALYSRQLPDDWRGIPVFCVGEKTRQVAQSAGAVQTVCGEEGVTALYPLIREKLSVGDRVLYLRGDVVMHDIRADLPGYPIDEIVVYRSVVAQGLPEDVVRNFSTIHTITVFSPRTATALKEIILQSGLIGNVPHINLLCLSASVLDSLRDMPWKAVYIADKPSQGSMVTLLKTLVQE